MSSIAIAPSTQELVLGRYRPVRPLGSGGSGSVWLARDEQTGLDLALKIVPREGKAAARAEREAHAARRLRHERCVRAYDVGHDASHVYIAYEYVPGRTVREALRAASLSDLDTTEIAAQVLDALAHAHRMGIVHRDVKPSNVLLEDADGISARLLDFGLAQFDGADTLTAAGDVPGTLAYISPERLAGAEATPESDVWSVGVMLWEALAGRHPFWGLPLQEIGRAIADGAPPLRTERSDLPRRLLAAVDGALAVEPGHRPRASALAADLRALLGSAPEKDTRDRKRVDAGTGDAPGLVLARRAATVVLTAVTTAIAVSLLPFWPLLLAVAIVAGAALGAWLDPRLGLAVTLGAAVFPLGNVAAGAAVLYGVLAACWLVLCWRDARHGLLFVAGPLLAPLGLLALLPLAVQPARGWARRGAQATVGVLAATLVAGIGGGALPLSGKPAGELALTPLTPATRVASETWSILMLHPPLVLGALLAGAAAAVLPWARSVSRLGVAAVGAVVLAGAVATGSAASIPLVLLVWAGAAGLAYRSA